MSQSRSFYQLKKDSRFYDTIFTHSIWLRELHKTLTTLQRLEFQHGLQEIQMSQKKNFKEALAQGRSY